MPVAGNRAVGNCLIWASEKAETYATVWSLHGLVVWMRAATSLSDPVPAFKALTSLTVCEPGSAHCSGSVGNWIWPSTGNPPVRITMAATAKGMAAFAGTLPRQAGIRARRPLGTATPLVG